MAFFSQDWFSHHIPRWNIWLSKFVGQPNLNFMEIGSYEGRSCLWLLENVLTDPSSKITCLDWFWDQAYHQKNGKSLEDSFHENLHGYLDRISVYCGRSFDSLLKLQNKQIIYDFIYIDGSHEQIDVLNDMMLSFQLLKVGGLMVMDDYHYKTQGMKEDPSIAIDAFLNVYNKKIKVIYLGCQVAIERCSV